MNERRLIQRLRELDGPVRPDPVFADALFATLRREATRRQIGFHRQWITALGFAAGAAFTLAIAVIAVGLLTAAPRGPAGSTVPAATPSASPLQSLGTPSPSAAAGDRWRPGAPPPSADVPLIAGFRQGQIWTLGLMDEPSQELEPHVLVYDVAADRWADRGPISYGTGSGSQGPWSAGIDPSGEIMVFGHRVAWRIDAETLDVSGSGPAPAGNRLSRSPMRGADGRFHMLEATGDALASPASLVTYDPRLDEWSDAPSIPTPRVRPLVAMDPAGGIHVIGGWTAHATGSQPLRSVERFDPTTGEWSVEPDLPEGTVVGGRRFGDAATFGPDGALHVYTYIAEEPGIAPDLGQTVIHRLDATTRGWTVVVPPSRPIEPHDAILTDEGSIVVLGHSGGAELDEPVTWIWDGEQ